MDENFKNLITCPITLEIFNNHVTLSNGHMYKRNVIVKILETNKISPITRKI